MNIPILSMGLALLIAMPFAHSDTPGERTHGPCFRVTIQSNAVNDARVEQSCDRNFSRTVQAGKHNSAHTIQAGRVNDNKVRQYQYDAPSRRHGN